GPRHDCFDLRFAQLAVETLSHVECGDFLSATETAIGAVVLSAMSGIDDDGRKSLARIFRRLWRSCASSQQSQETDGKSTTDQARHSDPIAKNASFTKGFSPVSHLFFGDCI